MLPRLEANERLDGITAGLASGNRMLEDHSRQRYIAQLERQLVGERRPKRASAENFGEMGVAVVIEKDTDESEKGGDET